MDGLYPVAGNDSALIPSGIVCVSSQVTSFTCDELPRTNENDEFFFGPRLARAWIDVAELLTQTHRQVALCHRLRDSLLGKQRWQLTEFDWQDFLASFAFNSWCLSALLVDPQRERGKIRCASAVFALELGMLWVGELPEALAAKLVQPPSSGS